MTSRDYLDSYVFELITVLTASYSLWPSIEIKAATYVHAVFL